MKKNLKISWIENVFFLDFEELEEQIVITTVHDFKNPFTDFGDGNAHKYHHRYMAAYYKGFQTGYLSLWNWTYDHKDIWFSFDDLVFDYVPIVLKDLMNECFDAISSCDTICNSSRILTEQFLESLPESETDPYDHYSVEVRYREQWKKLS